MRQSTRCIGQIKRKHRERRARKEEETPQDRFSRRLANATVWIAIFTGILLITTLISTRILWTSDAALNKAADASTKAAQAADSANKLNIVALRPWLYIESVKMWQNFSFDNDNVYLPLLIVLKNTGRLPAVDVAVAFSMRPVGDDLKMPDFASGQQQECAQHGIFRSSVFPSETKSENYMIAMPRNQFDRVKRGSEIVRIAISGCVNYRLAHQNEQFFTGVTFLAGSKVKAINPTGQGVIDAADMILVASLCKFPNKARMNAR